MLNMHHSRAGLLAFAYCFLVPTTSATPPQAGPPPNACEAVVKLTMYQGGTEIGAGTGFFISPDTIVTNWHVAAVGDECRVSDGAHLEGNVESVLWSSRARDLAVLQLDTTDEENKTVSGAIGRVGESVWICGNPQGLTKSLTHARISAIRGSSKSEQQVQLDGNIAPGSSGSPVMNAKGEVVAVITSRHIDEPWISFASTIYSSEATAWIGSKAPAPYAAWAAANVSNSERESANAIATSIRDRYIEALSMRGRELIAQGGPLTDLRRSRLDDLRVASRLRGLPDGHLDGGIIRWLIPKSTNASLLIDDYDDAEKLRVAMRSGLDNALLSDPENRLALKLRGITFSSGSPFFASVSDVADIERLLGLGHDHPSLLYEFLRAVRSSTESSLDWVWPCFAPDDDLAHKKLMYRWWLYQASLRASRRAEALPATWKDTSAVRASIEECNAQCGALALWFSHYLESYVDILREGGGPNPPIDPEVLGRLQMDRLLFLGPGDDPEQEPGFPSLAELRSVKVASFEVAAKVLLARAQEPLGGLDKAINLDFLVRMRLGLYLARAGRVAEGIEEQRTHVKAIESRLGRDTEDDLRFEAQLVLAQILVEAEERARAIEEITRADLILEDRSSPPSRELAERLTALKLQVAELDEKSTDH